MSHAPYCHLWPVRLYSIFPHYLISGTNYEKRHWMCVLISCTTSSESFLIIGITEWDMIVNVYRSSCTVPVILVWFELNLNFLEYFEKSLNIKFQENPSSLSRVIPCGKTDGRTDMMKLIVPFRNFANAPKSLQLQLKYGNYYVIGRTLYRHLSIANTNQIAYKHDENLTLCLLCAIYEGSW